MKVFPKDTLSLREAAKKYRITLNAVRKAAERRRLEYFIRDGKRYTTDQSVRKYLRDRDAEKIPKRYRKRLDL